jgi:tRNA (guanine37-N1)-methyltransferase
VRFDFVTLFPELIESSVKTGLFGRAVEHGIVGVRWKNPREFTTDRHGTVDDTPYGGGSGMVMMAGPVIDAIEQLDREAPDSTRARRILLTPQGTVFTQAVAERLSKLPAVMWICGRYEGIDARVCEHVDEELSLGDFVLNGGEVAALAMTEAVARLIPGVLGNQASVVEESHSSDGLLEYPQYTRPREFRGVAVPDVLLSGNHARIAAWRREQSLLRTQARRPDKLADVTLSDQERALLSTVGREGKPT